MGIGDAEQPAGVFFAEPFAQPVPRLLDIGHRGQPESFFQRQGTAVGGLAQQQANRAQPLVHGRDGQARARARSRARFRAALWTAVRHASVIHAKNSASAAAYACLVFSDVRVARTEPMSSSAEEPPAKTSCGIAHAASGSRNWAGAPGCTSRHKRKKRSE